MNGTSVRWTKRHVLDVEGWSREEILMLMEQARHMEDLMGRPIKKVPALRGKLAVNLFFENSTRTRVSFELAEKMLSADVVNWSSSGSSAAKGETLRDTAWTLEAMGADIVVIRHGAVGAAQYLAKKLKRAVVMNAGDGAHAHPTQCLLDLYTAWKHLGDLEGRKVAIVGDVEHSRVARSDVIGFKTMGCQVVLSGPSTLMPHQIGHLNVTYERDVRKALEGAHVIYLLRIQRERQRDGLFPSIDEYHRFWGATEELISSFSRDVLVMHPGPINRGVEIESSVADGENSVILEQVRSGVAVRMALLYLCAGGAA
ncbi:aspartate carbamoyltransferase [Thermanaerovibrio velox DSM 12556]|uniref:Aspartate carbamoyltransferase n=1 Tax=Thermanaerovibrio velox DSM 12556 TaxID=926567 RepID=H0US22_9BACT|nr:aspartate carbamoyltransferase catalytic subunit [Thermanaerovibrio velox]EHM10111.1 aspartate carbamoyltransferase [Thermanaerovibrio velox DSM 12556]